MNELDIDDLAHVSWTDAACPRTHIGHVEAREGDRLRIEGLGWITPGTPPSLHVRAVTASDLTAALASQGIEGEVVAIGDRSPADDLAAEASARHQ